ncbi:MAG: FAD-dependent oxidoreductase [Nocardioidaceae bacterium]
MAVVGSGVSGLTAAYLLRRTAHVTLFEASARTGGHVHTHHTALPDGSTAVVDSGFIVCNDQTYPTLLRLFAELGVSVRPTEMSMGIGCDGCGLQFVGGRGIRGIFAQRRRVADPRFWRFLLAVRRFQRLALLHLADDVDSAESYGDFLARHEFDDFFVNHYAVPVVSCVWSSGHDDALSYPAAYLFAFLDNHGFLRPREAPQWQVVAGGSSSYVDRILETLDRVETATQVTQLTRHESGVTLACSTGELGTFDAVVVATHADEALGLLTDATPTEKEVLGAFGYARNDAVLHRDESALPSNREARGGWNYRRASCRTRDERVQVSYWMNRLQHHDEASPLVVTLNAAHAGSPGSVIAEMSYTHPIYTAAARAAQHRLPELDSDQVAFAGAYHGWGFHEDGCRAGAAAARRLGAEW